MNSTQKLADVAAERHEIIAEMVFAQRDGADTSRLLDAKAKSYQSRRTSIQRAISFSSLGGEDDV
jgi:hypothetical protein